MRRALIPLLFSSLLCAQDQRPVDLNLRDLTGKKVQLKQYRGKVVVLNFWATWCGPCREELPLLVAEEKAWSQRGVTFIAVSLDDRKTADQVPAFIAKFGVTFPVWLGGTLDHLAHLKLGEGVPDTVFLDQDGVIQSRILGEVRKQEIEIRLTWLTSGKIGTPPQSLVNHM